MYNFKSDFRTLINIMTFYATTCRSFRIRITSDTQFDQMNIESGIAQLCKEI